MERREAQTCEFGGWLLLQIQQEEQVIPQVVILFYMSHKTFARPLKVRAI